MRRRPSGAYQISAVGGGGGVWLLDTRSGSLSYCWEHDIADELASAFLAEEAVKPGNRYNDIAAASRAGIVSDISEEEFARLAAAKKAGNPLPSVLAISCSSRRD